MVSPTSFSARPLPPTRATSSVHCVLVPTSCLGADADTFHLGVRADGRAGCLGGMGQRLGDATHAAAHDPVVLVRGKEVRPQIRRREQAAGRGRIAGVPGTDKYGLDFGRLEVLIQEVDDTPEQEALEQCSVVGAIDPAEHLGQRRWGSEEVRQEQACEPTAQLLERRKCACVVAVQARERFDRLFIGVPDQCGAAVWERAEQVWILRKDVQPVAA